MSERPAYGPKGRELAFRVYSDGQIESLWQYQSDSREDAVDCARQLFEEGGYTAVHVRNAEEEVFRLGLVELAEAGPRARLSLLAEGAR